MICFICLSANVFGQNSNKPKPTTTTYLFKNAHIVTSPGQIRQYSDVLVKDGLIVQVGKSIKAPYDAKIVETDSMYIYPAFIDGGSHKGYKEPKAEQPEFKATDTPTFEQSGITPQVSIRDFFNADALKSKREMGVGYVLVLPKGRMMPGQGSIVSTGKGTFSQKAIQENNVVYSTFKSARRYYPSTIMGVMKMYRDVFANTKNAKAYKAKYDTSPLGLKKMENTEEYNALFPVVEGKKALYFSTKKPKEILRALKLQKELGFKAILADVKLGSPVIKRIKRANNPVLLSLDLPKELKADKKDEEKKAKKNPLEERKRVSYENYIGQAKAFKDAGIKFGFVMGDLSGTDVKKNLARVVKAGLSEDAALAALTTDAAKILGIDKVAGSITKGKLANLMITDKPYFDEKSKIKYTFIDGILEKSKAKKEGKADKDYTGIYGYTIEIPGMTRSGIMDIKKDGDAFNVKLSTDEGGEYLDATNVVVNKNNFSFDLATPDGFNVKFDINFDDDKSFKGETTVADFGSFPITGKLKNPE